MPLKLTPQTARIYLLTAAFLLALPSALSLYSGHTGKFIIATPRANRDPNFGVTMVYIAYHNGWGAFGVVVNKPLPGDKIKKFLGNNKAPAEAFFYGGPVSPNEIFVIPQATKSPPKVIPLARFKNENPAQWEDFMAGKTGTNLRLYFGYAGWGALQLDKEMLRGSWAIKNYDPALFYETKPQNMWGRAVDDLNPQNKKNQPGI
ncbi:MAG: YqgE/AlgH family protein [Alphaproteobacteria bacterium]|nr:YqgE/AlgH family protein [Alphaproteobacteria bacterium]